MNIKKSNYVYGRTDERKDEEVALIELLFFFLLSTFWDTLLGLLYVCRCPHLRERNFHNNLFLLRHCKFFWLLPGFPWPRSKNRNQPTRRSIWDWWRLSDCLQEGAFGFAYHAVTKTCHTHTHYVDTGNGDSGYTCYVLKQIGGWVHNYFVDFWEGVHC